MQPLFTSKIRLSENTRTAKFVSFPTENHPVRVFPPCERCQFGRKPISAKDLSRKVLHSTRVYCSCLFQELFLVGETGRLFGQIRCIFFLYFESSKVDFLDRNSPNGQMSREIGRRLSKHFFPLPHSRMLTSCERDQLIFPAARSRIPPPSLRRKKKYFVKVTLGL